MANRIFIIPRRNDLEGIILPLTDLRPNAGQKNSIYEGTHQNVYVPEALDRPGATVVNGVAYVSGSLNTTLDGTHNDADDDTTGGGNDVTATQATAFGLAAYILDRVHGGGVALATAPPLTVANANNIATGILAAVEGGDSLTTTILSFLCNAEVADTDFDGAAANSRSFGTVEDVLRILSGETYRLPVLTILGEDSGGTSEFYALATREALVAAQTPAQITSQGQFYASGSFLTADDAGYKARPTLIQTGAFNISNAAGVLSHYKQNVAILNPNNAYSAAAVTALKPRAVTLDGNNIPATGLHPVLAVYRNDGTAL